MWSLKIHSYLALLGLSSQHFSGCRAFSEKETQSVLLQAHVPYGSGRLARLLPGVNEYKHLLGASKTLKVINWSQDLNKFQIKMFVSMTKNKQKGAPGSSQHAP